MTPPPVKPPLPPGAVEAAMRENRSVRVALQRLRPAERIAARGAIEKAIRARLRRDGWAE
jgi:hypothetical protein